MSTISVTFDRYLKINRNAEQYLFITDQSRDTLISANTFLLILRDAVQDAETKIQISKIIAHLSDMQYGFDTED